MAETVRSTRWRDVGLCAVAACLTFLSFPTAWAPELSLWPLIWVSHVPLLWVLKDKAPKQAFRWGLFCGTLINLGGYYWIADLLVTFGHLPYAVGLLGLLLHSVYYGLVWALWARICNRIGNTTSIGLEWTAPVVMVAIEWLVPRLFPAFMGNSQYLFTPIMQISDLFGVTAVTFLIYRVNAVLFLWIRARAEGRNRPRKAALTTAVMVAASLIYGGVRMYQFQGVMDDAPKLKVGLVEGDIGIFERESSAQRRDHLLIQQRLSAQLEAEGAELIIWPESAYRKPVFLYRSLKRMAPAGVRLPVDPLDDYRGLATVQQRQAPIRGFSTPLMFGSTSVERMAQPRWKGDLSVKPFNTAWLLAKDGTVVGSYDKNVLLMFGEFVPFAKYIPWIYQAVPAAGSLEPGTSPGLIEADLWGKGPIRFGMLICYEGILPTFTRRVAQLNPHLLVNMTNDDWFGESAERYLHLALAVPRAIEHRVAFVRPTLTGVSAFVDPLGRIVKQTRPQGPETLLWDVPLIQSVTVYRLIGDVFPWGCVLLMFGWYGLGRWRRRTVLRKRA